MNIFFPLQSTGSKQLTVLGQFKLTVVKGKGLITAYSAAYMSRLVNSSTFTILKVAADWHELEILRHVIAAIRCPQQRTIRPAVQHSIYTTAPISHNRPSAPSSEATTH